MPTDERILECLDKELDLTPAVVAHNIGKSREHVARRMNELADKGLANKVKRGYYEITDDGRAYLSGDVDASDLED